MDINKSIDECIEMLGLLIESAHESLSLGDEIKENTLLEDVKLSSFNYVLNRAISLLVRYQNSMVGN